MRSLMLLLVVLTLILGAGCSTFIPCGRGQECPRCKGQGDYRCSTCMGRGDARCSSCNGRGWQRTGKLCYGCNGVGQASCWVCEGAGMVPCGTYK